MDWFSPEQRAVIGRAAQVTRERLAPRAARYDEEARHPVESWRDLWEHGFLGMGIPREYGGMGLDPLTYVAVLEEIAKGCANTAMTAHMHSVVQRVIAAVGNEAQKRRYFAEVLDHGKLFGSWASEPGYSFGHKPTIKTTITSESNGRHEINGKKHFCTMAGACSYILVHAVWGPAKPGERPQPGNAIVRSDNPGVKITGEWNTLGMRATVSPAATFEHCVVEDDAILLRPGERTPVELGWVELFFLGYAAVLLGCATGAFDSTVDYVKRTPWGPGDPLMAQTGVVQRHVGEMGLSLEGTRLVIYQVASRWGEAQPALRGVWASKAKLSATQTALAVTTRAMQVIGGRAASKSIPVERAFRDARTCSLMPPPMDLMLQTTGKGYLGMTEDLAARQLGAKSLPSA